MKKEKDDASKTEDVFSYHLLPGGCATTAHEDEYYLGWYSRAISPSVSTRLTEGR